MNLNHGNGLGSAREILFEPGEVSQIPKCVGRHVIRIEWSAVSNT